MRNRTAISSLTRGLCLLICSSIVTPSHADKHHNGKGAGGEIEHICAPFTTTASGSVEASNVPYSDSVFWRIDGGDKPSYILGTVHSQDRRVAQLSPAQRLRLARSDRLLIEVVPDPAANRRYLNAMYADDGTGLDERLPAPLYRRLRRIASDYGLPTERVADLKPWAAFSQIGRPQPVSGPTLDQRIHETAMRMDKPIHGLEKMAELIDTLASLPMDDQMVILKDTICNHTRIVRESKTLVDHYLADDLAGMVAFNKQPHYDEAVFERFMQTMVYDRNRRMFERLQPHLAPGGNFIALGALHLPEEDGLLALIEAAGYSVEPVN
ncbi:uncharacterized protein YbaP (TraB family) [Methylohalomonas lacus]|uniref:Uncharacterized protein YbaP (TraB family) n=1 Tax=Methylohalomonas lacus TaxID=398773 RepID=A0AAE3HLD1_9GAMM|nr:TraB/GumN family protein [Methylohalomonas lacus]MCS3902548.1 uncharacterized protein YbaP (TraB family) [Methylohalomonas lacus]